MIRFIVWLLFFVNFSWATPLLLNASSKTTNTIPHQITIEDKNHTLNSLDILYNRFNSFTTNTKSSYTKSAFWTKSEVKNNTNKPIQYIFRNNRAGTDKIDVYVYDNNQLIAEHTLGDLRGQDKREILATKSVFLISFAPYETLTVISKYSSLGGLDLQWEILPVDRYSYINGSENIFFGIFGGIIFALIIYNFILFISLREKIFLLYALQGSFVGWFVFAVSGVFYFLDFGLELSFLTATTWLAPILMMLFLMLFISEFFSLSSRSKVLYGFTLFFVGVAIGYFCIFFYGYLFDDKDIFIAYSSIYLNISLLSYIFIGIVALWGVYKKIAGAIYIAIGEIIYILAILFITLVFKGASDFSSFAHFVIPFGVMVEMVFFALALGTKIKQIKIDLENAKTLSLQEEHYTEYGKIVGNISHQWKQPLSYLSSQIMYLSSLKTVNKGDMIEEEFLAVAPKLNYTIELMANTINLFNDFYQNPNEKTTLHLNNELEHLVAMYEYKLISNNIEVKLECDEELEFFTFKISFLQIIMTLLDNSIEQFEKSEAKEGVISLTLKKKDTTLLVIFEDNAGGIKLPLETIFDPYISSKNQKGGMGLHILKTILTEKLFGKIEVKNSQNGAIFTLELPLNLKGE